MKTKINIPIFLLLFILIFLLIDSVYQQEYIHSKWRKFEKLEENSIDVVLFGNSHGYNTFNQNLLNDLLSKNTLVIGEGGTSFPIVFFELSKILKTQKPEYIVIESYLFDSPIKENRYINYLQNSKLDLLDFLILKDFFEPENYWWISELAFNHSEIYKNPYMFFDYFKNIIDNDKKPKEILELSWYSPLNRIIDKNTHNQAFIEEKKELDNNSYQIYLDYFEKLIKICDKNNIKILLVRNPMQVIELEKLEPELQYFIEKNNISFKNFDETMNLGQIDFFNINHVSSMGSFKVTLELANFISNNSEYKLNTNLYYHYLELLYNEFEYNTNNGIYISMQSEQVKNDQLFFEWRILYNGGDEKIINTFEPEIYIKSKDIQSIILKISSDETTYPIVLEFSIQKTFQLK